MNQINHLLKMLTVALSVIFCAGNIEARQSSPMKPLRDISIPDGEILNYSSYSYGEKYQEIAIVTKRLTNNTIKVYFQAKLESSSNSLSDNFTNYNSYMIIDLLKGSQLEYLFDDSINMKEKKDNIMYYINVKIGAEIITVNKFWDGYESRETVRRVKNRETNYPAWELASFTLVGIRYMDWENGGLIYIATSISREMVKCSAYKIKDHVTIKTPAGTFDTAKVGFACADPFLGSLLKQFTDSFTFYIENNKNRRIIKLDDEADNQVWYLNRIGTVK